MRVLQPLVDLLRFLRFVDRRKNEIDWTATISVWLAAVVGLRLLAGGDTSGVDLMALIGAGATYQGRKALTWYMGHRDQQAAAAQAPSSPPVEASAIAALETRLAAAEKRTRDLSVMAGLARED